MKLQRRGRPIRPADAPTAGQALQAAGPTGPALLGPDLLGPDLLGPGAGELPGPGDLELPRPVRLALTAGWNLAESLGLPLAAYLAGTRFGGQHAGMAAATAVIWLTGVVRKVVTGSVPGLLIISGLVFTLQTVLVLATGSVLFFLLQFPVANLALCILFAWTAPTGRPLVAQLAREVVSLSQKSADHPGLLRFFRGVTWLWAGIFAASTIGLAVALFLEPAAMFLLLSTVVTVGGTAAGILLSVVWFIRMARRSGLRVRFGAA